MYNETYVKNTKKEGHDVRYIHITKKQMRLLHSIHVKKSL